jgi:hypothetical protein
MTSLPVGTSALPPLYERWIEEFLQSPPPAESRSTCQDCPMISADPARNASEHHFNPRTKCCTYWPELPNFLAGFILQDEDPSFARARAQMETFLVTKEMMITPLGATPPPSFFEQYNKLKSFGTDLSLRCPFYQEDQTGNCGIWKYRNGRCATWFCRFSRGSVSVVFWKYMDQLFNAIEKSLSRWCVLQFGFANEALQQIFPPPRTQMRISATMWDQWLGREREFFVECSRSVAALHWNDVSRIGGIDLEVPARLLRESHLQLLRHDLPASLKLNQWKHWTAADPEMMRIWTYSRYDPIEVPRRIVDVLSYFQNCTTEQALARIEQEKGIRLDREYVRMLTDFGVLTAS